MLPGYRRVCSLAQFSMVPPLRDDSQDTLSSPGLSLQPLVDLLYYWEILSWQNMSTVGEGQNSASGATLL